MNSNINMYAIHDKKANTFETPFCLPNNAYAIRSFQDVVNKDTVYGKYPQDFELVQIGGYNQENGQLIPLPKPAVIVQASDLKQSEVNKK